MIIILNGKSGCGKDTILNELKDFDIEALVSTTTRPKRDYEVDGKDYNFIPKDDFLDGIENDAFIEYRKYDTLVNNIPDTWYYGMPKMELNKDKNYMAILDIEGTESFINYYGKDNLFIANIETDDDIRKLRAENRGSFDISEWNRRLADDEIKFANAKDIADIVIQNNNNDMKEIKYNIIPTLVDAFNEKVYDLEKKLYEIELEDKLTKEISTKYAYINNSEHTKEIIEDCLKDDLTMNNLKDFGAIDDSKNYNTFNFKGGNGYEDNYDEELYYLKDYSSPKFIKCDYLVYATKNLENDLEHRFYNIKEDRTMQYEDMTMKRGENLKDREVVPIEKLLKGISKEDFARLQDDLYKNVNRIVYAVSFEKNGVYQKNICIAENEEDVRNFYRKKGADVIGIREYTNDDYRPDMAITQAPKSTAYIKEKEKEKVLIRDKEPNYSFNYYNAYYTDEKENPRKQNHIERER